MFQAIKGNPEVVGAVGVTSTILGIAYSEQKNAQRHRENLQVARETSEASVKAQQKLVDAQLAVAQSQATLARSQERLAVAQERANALKMQQDLLPSKVEVKAPSLMTEKEEMFSFWNAFFF